MANRTFTQVTPHVSRLELSAAAAYLVKAADGWTLVDTGLEKETDIVMQAVLQHTKGETPRLLILTHGHPENAGGALTIRNRWRLRVAAGREEIPYLTEPVFYRKIPGRSLRNYLAALFIQPAMLGRGIDLPLDDGSVISEMTVYHLPGHAPGMVALLHRADRALICGDAFTSRGSNLADPSAALTYDMRLHRKGQRRLAALDFDHVLPSHGPVIMNDGKRAAMALVERHFGKGALAPAAGSKPATAH